MFHLWEQLFDVHNSFSVIQFWLGNGKGCLVPWRTKPVVTEYNLNKIKYFLDKDACFEFTVRQLTRVVTSA